MTKESKPPTEIELLTDIRECLKSLVALNALSYTAGKNQQAAIESFAQAGLTAKAISDMTGWPTTSVAPALSKAKAKTKGRAK